ncbi:DUF11 domain-containing protein [Jannaschia sp. Os4]|uniref:DUF7507 domain-containing protein n=1 Tax=Jannaschia sp. Os4 TaxID=2807617 RepID=UPI001939F808|nr:DUF11 domain-containing protein [Jannaschia sp. Os4]MBM2578011.1 DUF11 domain-containing protein [Jannaschia sp. Os4]
MVFGRTIRALGRVGALALGLGLWSGGADATPFTTQVPGTGLTIPANYPEAGGAVIVLVGVNGNSYFQFSDPSGAFRGFQNSGQPARFRGNPFTINDPISLDCGASTCATYFGGSLAAAYVRFTAYDGDTAPGEFDENRITLRLNGFDVGSWSGLPTQATNLAGTTAFSSGTGFGNNLFATGWFSSTNPQLLANILSTGRTTTQVFDRTPNDNFWDFTLGNSLQDEDIRTVAPGYELTKGLAASEPDNDYLVAGETFDFEYVVTNIGSVPIDDLQVIDDKIADVTCDVTRIEDVAFGQTPNAATCTGTYTITQEDVDRGSVTNVAQARGTPEEGTLGALTERFTLDGPPNPVARIRVRKETVPANLARFGEAGSVVSYVLNVDARAPNGAGTPSDVTLRNVVVTDALFPGYSCTIPEIAPGDRDSSCTVDYTVTQADVDAWLLAGEQKPGGRNGDDSLQNSATAVGESARDGSTVSHTDTDNLDGPAPRVTLTVAKTAAQSEFDDANDEIDYTVRVTNTGNVTWQDGDLTVTDPLLPALSCPAGAVAPGATVTCTGTYAVDQDDVDEGGVDNIATAAVAVDLAGGTATAQADDDLTVPSVRTLSASLDKRLAAGQAGTFSAAADTVAFEYVVTNTGTVTIDAVAVTDDRGFAVTCPAGGIAPGASATCTGTDDTFDQEDLDAGSVTNTAEAVISADGLADVTTDEDSVTVTVDAMPSLALVKTPPVVDVADFVVGATITYAFDVTNDGNVTLTQANTGAARLTVTDDRIGAVDCGPLPLAPGVTVRCTGAYELTADDVASGVVNNVASAAAGTATSPQVTAQVSIAGNPALSLEKTSTTADVDAVTDTIDYVFTVTNDGDTQIVAALQPVTITDARLTGPAVCAQPPTLDPGQSFQCTGQRVGVTQAELDAGSVENSATASFPFERGGVTTTIASDAATASVPVDPQPSFTFSKDGPATFSAAGEELTYTFTVTNDGNVTLTSASVSDPRIPGLSCALGPIAPGGSDDCTGTLEVSQAEFDAGTLLNSATASVVPAQGSAAPVSDGHVVTRAPGAGTFAPRLDKTADRAAFAAPGETIAYTLTVTNDGTLTIPSATVADPLAPASFSCVVTDLAPAASTSCSFDYVTDQDDVDTGGRANVATLSSPSFPDVKDGVTVDGPARTAALEMTKEGPASFSGPLEDVTFRFRVRNAGNVTLTDVTVTDEFFDPDLTCVIGSLAPGEEDATTCTATYRTGQGDLDVGSITNTADVNATAPAGVAAPDEASAVAVVDGPARTPSVSIAKVADKAAFAAPVDSLTFTFEVENTGNVTLTDLVVTDPALGFSCPVDDLAPGETATACSDATPLSAVRPTAQPDVDAGQVVNSATVAGEAAESGAPVEDTVTISVPGPAQTVAIEMTKSSPDGAGFDTVGQIVTYEFEVTNRSNVTLTAPITISDAKVPNAACPAGPVAPGASVTCSGTYEVTQADLDAGTLDNTATASVTQPVVPSGPNAPTELTATDGGSESLTPAQRPALTIEKRLKAGQAASFDAVGDLLTFEYVVTNAGNVTTTAPVTVEDDKIAGVLSCAPAGLAPGASVTCEQDYEADQTGLDDGVVTNTASAKTVFDGVEYESNDDSVTIVARQDPSLSIVKTFEGVLDSLADTTPDPNGGTLDVGTILRYRFVVTNDGDVTLAAPFAVVDSIGTPVCASLPATLAPGGSFACTMPYVVIDADLDAQGVFNNAFATGTFDGAPVRSPDDGATFPRNVEPNIDLQKEVVAVGGDTGRSTFAEAGEVVTYRYTYTNAGNVGIPNAITISDDKIGTRICRTEGAPSLPVGGTGFCEFDYVVTQADADANVVTNVATAATEFRGAVDVSIVTSEPQSVTVEGTASPELAVVKLQTAGPLTAALGEELTYTITVTNTGDQTLSAIDVADLEIDDLACTIDALPAPANIVLGPTDAVVCVGTYEVTQADVDRGSFTNTATATGATPQGGTVSGTDRLTVGLVDQDTSFAIEKTLFSGTEAGEDFSSAGQVVSFQVAVENTGNVTIVEAVITDDLDVTPASCTVGPIAPGATDTSCRFDYEVTQADVDAELEIDGETRGGFTNVARATVTYGDPDGTVETGSDDLLVVGPLREPRLSLAKEADLSAVATVGETVTYTFTVLNSGNVTLEGPIEIDDDRIGVFDCAGLPPGGLPPLATYACTATDTVEQADLDGGSMDNVAVATATSEPLAPTATARESVPATQTPGLAVEKVADRATAAVGETITYTHTVTNTGNVTLTDVTLRDRHESASGTEDLAVTDERLVTEAGETDATDATAGDGVWSSLGAGDVIAFTTTYEVTQADVDAQAALTNTARVRADPADGSDRLVETSDASVNVPGKAAGLEVTKTADTTALSSPPAEDEVVTFTIQVRNAGNVTLTGVDLTDTPTVGTTPGGAALTLSDGPTLASGDADSDLELDVGETWVYTATLDLTQAALDAGGLSNAAAATADDPQGAEVEDGTDAPVTVPLDRDAAITVVKAASLADGGDGADAGDVITYDYTVANAGNVTLEGIVLAETGFGGVGDAPVPTVVSGGPDLAPGESMTFRATYALEQGDVDAGGVTNQATATGTGPQGDVSDLSGGTVDDDDPTETALLREPGLTVVKSAVLVDDGDGRTGEADSIAYTYVVENTGNVTLTGVGVDETGFGGAGDAPEPVVQPGGAATVDLEPGGTATFVATYELEQGDLDRGEVENQATATGQDPEGADVSDVSGATAGDDDATVTDLMGVPELTLVKTVAAALGADGATAGDVLTYTYLVTNSGTVTVDGVDVTEPGADFSGTGDDPEPVIESGGSTTLAPGESVTFTATYEVTQTDVDAGEVRNRATATGDDPMDAGLSVRSVDGEGDPETVAALPATPEVLFEKTPSVTADVVPGDEITYTYRVENTGNVTLTGLSVADLQTSAAGTAALDVSGETLVADAGLADDSTDAADDGTWDVLAPGDAVTFEATYEVTQADVDAGDPLTNAATLSATDSAGDPVTATDDASVAPEPGAPGIEVVKTADTDALSAPPAPGETVTFEITVANTGNVTLGAPVLTDSLTRADATPVPLDAPVLVSGDADGDDALSVGETWTYAASHVLTQEDIDAGGLVNVARATAGTPDGSVVTDVSDDGDTGGGDTGDDPTRVGLDREPGIETAKVVTEGADASEAGDVIRFEITAANTGNVTLDGVTVASDVLTRADGTELALDAGPDFAGNDDGSGEGTLRPGETARWTASYALTQADVDAGGIGNVATVAGTGPDGTPVDDPSDPATVTVDPDPALSLVKRPAADAPAAVSEVDEALPFEFVVTNDGNVTITGAITIDDPLVPDAACPVLAEGLAPGLSTVCTGTYAVTQDDLDRGSVINAATATGGGVTTERVTATVPARQEPALEVTKTAAPIAAADFVVGAVVSYEYLVVNTGNVTLTDPVTVDDNLIDAVACPALPALGLAPEGELTCTATYEVTADDVDLGVVTNVATATSGGTTSIPATATVPDAGTPALSIVKAAEAGATFAEVGDEIRYDFTVTNSGTRAFVRAVEVVDDRLGTILCYEPTAADPDFRPGETVSCSSTDVATQDDLDAGEIVNAARGTTTFGGGTPVSSDVVTETVEVEEQPLLTLGKTVADLPATGLGQILTYTLTATNEGNQTLEGVRVTDPLLSGFVCAAPTLARGDSLVCTGTYEVTQDDVDEGAVPNEAEATGETTTGTPVGAEASVTVDLPDAAPSLALTKTATPTPFGPVGSTLTYALRAVNDGDVTLEDVAVTDSMAPAGFSCEAATLPVGAALDCAFGVTVGQEDVDRGEIFNEAEVVGTGVRGGGASDEAELTTDGPDREPALEVTKTVAVPGRAAGDVVEFEIRVENVGNVTLTGVTLEDTLTRLDGTPLPLDAAPTLDAASDADGDGALDVGETWIYRAARTLDQDDVNAGGVRNVALARAFGPAGRPAFDLSDDGDDGDGDSAGDPTDAVIPSGPKLDAVKVVSQSGAAAGDTVVFRVTATNVGNVDLTDLTLSDVLTRADGTSISAEVTPVDVPATLSPGAAATWDVSRVLTQADVDSGGLRNVAIVSGEAPDRTRTTDVSDDGDDTDGDPNGDPTEAPIVAAPDLEVVKTLVEIGAAEGEAAVFEIAVRNAGNVTLTGVDVADETTGLDGSDPRDVAPDFVSADAGSPAGTLQVGETATYAVEVALTQADVDAGGVLNSATASGTTPGGTGVSGASDLDGTGEGRPTPGPVAAAPALAVEKTVLSSETLFPTIVRSTFRIEVTNTGNVTQTGMRVADDLAAFAAPGELLAEAYPPIVTQSGFGDGAAVNPGFDGAADTELLAGDGVLGVGATGTVDVTATYVLPAGGGDRANTAAARSDQLGDPSEGSAVVGANDRDGDGVPDDIESASADRDGDGIPDVEDFDPTGFLYCEDDGRILSGGQITVRGGGAVQTGVGVTGPINVVADGTLGFYQFFVTAPGAYTLEVSYPPVGTPSATRTPGGTLDATSLLPEDPASLGSNERRSSGVLADFSAAANPFFTSFEFEAGDPYIVNNNIPVMSCGAVRDVVAAKTADRTTAALGESVGYTLSFRNDTQRDLDDVVAIDRLPAGLVYTPDSARVAGSAQEPAILGSDLRWTLDLPAGATRTVTFRARVTTRAGYGSVVNETVLTTADGRVLSNTATAAVRIEPEAVFACSDVIGKVFDDRNMNGYQDPPSRGITDQAYDAGKGGVAPAELVGEPGLAGVRLVAPDGTIITTDGQGRYSVPCAALPEREGSNFVLKLDPRSLPTGYRVTTENPRVIRLTAGKMARLNFGAAVGRVVDIDLTARAFAADGSPRRELGAGVDALVARIAAEPSLLRLTYVTGAGEDRAAARARLSAVEDLIRARWRGRYRLEIEKTLREGR